MVYKSCYGLTPSYLSSKFIQLSDMITSYNYNLRNSENKFAIPLPRAISITKIALATLVQSSGTVCLQLLGKQHL